MVSLRLMVVFTSRKAAFRDLRNWVWEFYRKGGDTIRANTEVTKIAISLADEYDRDGNWIWSDLQELVKTWRAIDRAE